ncbi:hypothetical protein GC722_16240 [Auraticoccus sp. F435]|uniref:N-acetyltransferase domain-containing protein n=1 Tax=Auraticoccus cholistanensis TaxID=2656650 RepID=A0A6A9V1W0_9ACTN|nr:hypothetical protein [Auraticoccus cholistanensis]MVA77554.1 hypothetical protein [Auraticoccus cholistanensis]
MGDPTLVEVTGAEELAEASALYRRVFGYLDPGTALNPRLLLSMLRHGGIALGARDGDGRLVAFAYGWTGLEAGRPFHYSQAVVISPEWQSRGLGRRIKHAQRERALALGLQQMRWSFDPLLAVNAHFNLDVLGAVGHEVVPDLFGPGEHRLVVQWDLRHPRTPLDVPGLDDLVGPDLGPGGVAAAAGLRLLVVPARPRRDPGLSTRVVHTLQQQAAEGFVAAGCRRLDDDRSVYLLAHPEER